MSTVRFAVVGPAHNFIKETADNKLFCGLLGCDVAVSFDHGYGRTPSVWVCTGDGGVLAGIDVRCDGRAGDVVRWADNTNTDNTNTDNTNTDNTNTDNTNTDNTNTDVSLSPRELAQRCITKLDNALADSRVNKGLDGFRPVVNQDDNQNTKPDTQTPEVFQEGCDGTSTINSWVVWNTNDTQNPTVNPTVNPTSTPKSRHPSNSSKRITQTIKIVGPDTKIYDAQRLPEPTVATLITNNNINLPAHIQVAYAARRPANIRQVVYTTPEIKRHALAEVDKMLRQHETEKCAVLNRLEGLEPPELFEDIEDIGVIENLEDHETPEEPEHTKTFENTETPKKPKKPDTNNPTIQPLGVLNKIHHAHETKPAIVNPKTKTDTHHPKNRLTQRFTKENKQP